VPGDVIADSDASRPPRSGEHEHQLAVGTVVQQASQVVAVLAMLAVVTVLARRLTLTEFGTYALLVSLTAYVQFVQGSVETAAVKAIAEATDQDARDRAFSTAISMYVVAGVAVAVVIATLGTALLPIFGIPARLEHQAHLSVLALSMITLAGWPLKVFQDVLRGAQQFTSAAVAEIVAYSTVAVVLITLTFADAPLWLLVAIGASVPLAIGATSAGLVRARRLPYRFHRHSVGRESVRGFLHLTTYLFFIGVSDLVIYSLDRAILASFRSATTVGLYEGPIRAHNLVRQLHGTLAGVVVPASARYLAERDVMRTRDLLVRGTRYTVAAVVPLTIVLMVLARPILTTWLGPEFGVAATGLTVLVAYWLLNANTGVAGSMLVAAGRVRQLAVYAALVAVLNLALSLALTPSLGLNGVVLGTTLSYVVLFPFFLRLVLATFEVPLRELAREAWVPGYVTGAVLAVALLAIRATVPLDSFAVVAALSLGALLGYWGLYYLVWLRPAERTLVKNVARTLVGR